MTDKSSRDEKGFDWGPPANAQGDLFKEWMVYLVLFFLIGGGVWMLIEPTARSQHRPLPASGESLDQTLQTASASMSGGQPNALSAQIKPSEPPMQVKNGPVYMIQLGVFGDEETAKIAYQRLKSHGFAGSIALPDEHYEMYRLLVGPFAAEREAETMARRLNELDFPCFVIESP